MNRFRYGNRQLARVASSCFLGKARNGRARSGKCCWFLPMLCASLVKTIGYENCLDVLSGKCVFWLEIYVVFDDGQYQTHMSPRRLFASVHAPGSLRRQIGYSHLLGRVIPPWWYSGAGVFQLGAQERNCRAYLPSLHSLMLRHLTRLAKRVFLIRVLLLTFLHLLLLFTPLSRA